MTDTKWTEELVAEFLEKAVRTLRRLPPVKVRGYHSLWPEILYTPNEIIQMDKPPLKWRASGYDITCMEATFEWISLIKSPGNRKLLWARAKRVPWKTLSYASGLSDKTLRKYWKMQLEIIKNDLNDCKSPRFQRNYSLLKRYLPRK